ncbi:MAG: hypothetical protein KAQ69_10240 [Spirochaetales bacterium]|nr:hypothetical protein [Spirochaetales bacterium]
MEYFTVKAPTYEAAVRKIREQYGNYAKIHSKKVIRKKRFPGFSHRTEVEVTGYLSVTDTQSGSAGVDPAFTKNTDMGEVLSELEKVRNQLAMNEEKHAKKQSLIEKIVKILQYNDFTPGFIDNVCNKISEDENLLSSNDVLLLESKALGYIADSIVIDTAGQRHLPQILVLMGPTGVGKTTTVAKIAAVHGLGSGMKRNKKVSIVTIDNYRIGAKNQIETFGDIMSIPVTSVSSPLALDTFLHDHADSDLILIDTIGKSPKDQDIYDEMQRILSVCGSSTKFCLTLSASMKFADMIKTIDRFLSFRISTLILTKLDETEILGNALSVIAEKKLPVLYVTTGQKVPQDLIPASIGFFMRALKGFNVDVENLTFGGFGEEIHENTSGESSIFGLDDRE